VAISAGLRHSLALTSDGHVVGWGNSFIGEISGPPSGTYAAISAGGGFSTAITSAGKLVSWYDGGAGDNDVPAALATTSFTAVSAGHSRTLALAKDGTLYSWGTATPTDPVAVPASLAGRTVTALSASENDTSLVATLGHFTAGVTVSGTRVVGHRLHATVGPTPEGTTVALQWLRNGSAIPGSTGTTYLLRVADARTHLVARATLTKPMYDVGHPASTATPAIRLPALTLRVTCDPTSVHRHRTFTVGTAGLVAGEAYHLTLGGRSLASGHATSRGRVTRRLTMPGTAPLGVRRLTVTGSQADRTGSRSVRVLPRG
jgi:hypothetical protein